MFPAAGIKWMQGYDANEDPYLNCDFMTSYQRLRPKDGADMGILKIYKI